MTALPPFSSFDFAHTNISRSTTPARSCSPSSRHTPYPPSPNSHPHNSPHSASTSLQASFHIPPSAPTNPRAEDLRVHSSPQSSARPFLSVAQPWPHDQPVGMGFAESRKRKLDEAGEVSERLAIDQIGRQSLIPPLNLALSYSESHDRSKASYGFSSDLAPNSSDSLAPDPYFHPSYYAPSSRSPTDSAHSFPSPSLQTPHTGTFLPSLGASTYYAPPLKYQRSTPSFASTSSGSSFSSVRSSERSNSSSEWSIYSKLPPSRQFSSFLGPFDIPGSSAHLPPPSALAPPTANLNRRPYTIETTRPSPQPLNKVYRPASQQLSEVSIPPLPRHNSDPSPTTRSPPRDSCNAPPPPATPGSSLASSISILSLLNGSPPPPLPPAPPTRPALAPSASRSSSSSFSSVAPPHLVTQSRKSVSHIDRAPIQRTTRACDACRGRKTRCLVEEGMPRGRAEVGQEVRKTCNRCREMGLDCVWSGGSKKRGPVAGSARPQNSPAIPTTDSAHNQSQPLKQDSYFIQPHPSHPTPPPNNAYLDSYHSSGSNTPILSSSSSFSRPGSSASIHPFYPSSYAPPPFSHSHSQDRHTSRLPSVLARSSSLDHVTHAHMSPLGNPIWPPRQDQARLGGS